MNTNLGTTNANTPIAIPATEPSHWKVVVGLMLLGAVVGTIALLCYQLSTEEKKENWAWTALKNFGMALGAVALIPAFLRTISSTLLSQMETGIEARFVFVSFCVAASYAARRFLATVPQRLLDSVNKAAANASQAKSQADETQERLDQVVEVVANKTASAHSGPAPQGVQADSSIGYDERGILVARAMINPKYPKSRSTVGVAFDTGLTVPDALNYLRQMQERGDVQPFLPYPIEQRQKKGTWWSLTDQGLQKFRSLPPQSAADEVNIQ